MILILLNERVQYPGNFRLLNSLASHMRRTCVAHLYGIIDSSKIDPVSFVKSSLFKR